MDRRIFLALIATYLSAPLINIIPKLTREDVYPLPKPSLKGLDFNILLKKASIKYNSINKGYIDPGHLPNILWCGDGVTEPIMLFRASPSPGATYPIDIFVRDPDGNLYKYIPDRHSLKPSPGSVKPGKEFILTFKYSRTTDKYGSKGVRYARLESGHIYFNMYLESLQYGYLLKYDGKGNELVNYDETISIKPYRLRKSIDGSREYSIEKVILRRRSIRRYKKLSIGYETLEKLINLIRTIKKIYQINFDEDNLDTYLNLIDVNGYKPGLYKLTSSGLEWIGYIDAKSIYKTTFTAYFFKQYYILDAKFHIIIAYKDWGFDKIDSLLKTGFYTEGILLTLVYLGLGGTSLGGFDNKALNKLISLEEGFDTKYIIPVGWPLYG